MKKSSTWSLSPPPPPKPKRGPLSSVDNAAIDQLDRDRVLRGSRQTTDKCLKIAKDYFKENEIECDVATNTEVKLGKRL